MNKDKLTAALKRPKEKRRWVFIISSLLTPLFLLLLLLPYLMTTNDGATSFISGYASFALYEDAYDISRYGVGCLIFSLIVISAMEITSLMGLFSSEKNIQRSFVSTLVLLIVSCIFDVIATILFSLTETNIQLAFGSFLIPILKLLSALGLAFIKNNTREENKEEEEPAIKN